MREIPRGWNRLHPVRAKDIKTSSKLAQRPLKESGLAAESIGSTGKHSQVEVVEIFDLRFGRAASIRVHSNQSVGIKINSRLSPGDQPE